jgi:hypothetical protein
MITIAKVVLMVLLIYRWELYGLIISAFIAYAIEIFLLWYNLKNDFPMKFNIVKLIGVPLFLFFVIVITESQLNGNYLTVTHLFYGLLCVILLAAAYRNELKMLYLLKISK